jgi:hypothetical protein
MGGKQTFGVHLCFPAEFAEPRHATIYATLAHSVPAPELGDGRRIHAIFLILSCHAFAMQTDQHETDNVQGGT